MQQLFDGIVMLTKPYYPYNFLKTVEKTISILSCIIIIAIP